MNNCKTSFLHLPIEYLVLPLSVPCKSASTWKNQKRRKKKGMRNKRHDDKKEDAQLHMETRWSSSNEHRTQWKTHETAREAAMWNTMILGQRQVLPLPSPSSVSSDAIHHDHDDYYNYLLSFIVDVPYLHCAIHWPRQKQVTRNGKEAYGLDTHGMAHVGMNESDKIIIKNGQTERNETKDYIR